MYDGLEQLLRETDRMGQSDPTAVPRDMASSILLQKRVRDRRKLQAAITVAVLGFIAVMAMPFRHTSKEHAIFGPATKLVVPEVPLLEGPDQDKIAVHQVNFERMLAEEQLAQNQQRLARLEELPTTDEVVERAASAIVFQADRLLDRSQTRASAVRAFQDVVTHFPNTVSAAIAREKLEQIEKQG